MNMKLKLKKLLICCGAWSNLLLKNSMNISFEMRPLKGVSMIFQTNKKCLRITNGLRKFILLLENNQTAVGATEDEKGFEEMSH